MNLAPSRPARFLKAAVAAGLLGVAGCSHGAPPRPVLPDAGSTDLSDFAPPSCGARIFVAMGANQQFPGDEKMRVPRGDLFLNGDLVDQVSKDPEITVIDVPAGRPEQLSWVPSKYDDLARGNTRQNPLALTLSDHETVFVVLDWYDDTPPRVGFGVKRVAKAIRTEVARADRQGFLTKHIVFQQSLGTRCGQAVAARTAAPSARPVLPAAPPAPVAPVAPSPPPAPTRAAPVTPQGAVPWAQAPQEMTAAASPAPAAPVQRSAPPLAPTPPPLAKAEPVAPRVEAPHPVPPPPVPLVVPPPPPPESRQATVAPPAPPPAPPASAKSTPPETQQASLAPTFWPPAHYAYYVVSAPDGAAAFGVPQDAGTPLYTFKTATELSVTGVSSDSRWLKVRTPDGQTAFVSTLDVTVGARAAK